MGFYAPAQLVRDARAHGVEVRAVDVTASHAECTLGEKGGGTDQPAVRLGLNRARGLSRAGAERLLAARGEAAFADVQDLARRARLDTRDLQALAAVGALAALAGHRRAARWQAAGISADALRALPLLAEVPVHEPAIELPAPAEGEEIAADYAAIGHSMGRHPVALLRPHLACLRIEPASRLATFPHERIARAAGLVTHRQRPDTARGVVFVTHSRTIPAP